MQRSSFGFVQSAFTVLPPDAEAKRLSLIPLIFFSLTKDAA